MATIAVSRQKAAHSTCELLDVLTAIEPCSLDLNWYFVEFESGFFRGTSNEEPRLPSWIVDLCDEIESQRAGVHLPWEKLKALASIVRPADMALLIATKPGLPAPSWPLDITCPQFEIAIQGVADDFWNVTTRNAAVIAQLRENFQDAQMVC